MDRIILRPVQKKDAFKLLNIYEPYVKHTNVTAEYITPTVLEMEGRIEQYGKNMPWLVCEVNGEIIGYTYAKQHRDRAGYAWSVETSIYIKDSYHQKGMGALLYKTLFSILMEQGFYNVFVGIIQANQKSIAFHEKMGFSLIGIERNGMYKRGVWNNTHWMQKILMQKEHPGEIIPWEAFQRTNFCEQLLQSFLPLESKKQGCEKSYEV